MDLKKVLLVSGFVLMVVALFYLSSLTESVDEPQVSESVVESLHVKNNGFIDVKPDFVYSESVEKVFVDDYEVNVSDSRPVVTEVVLVNPDSEPVVLDFESMVFQSVLFMDNRPVNHSTKLFYSDTGSADSYLTVVDAEPVFVLAGRSNASLRFESYLSESLNPVWFDGLVNPVYDDVHHFIGFEVLDVPVYDNVADIDNGNVVDGNDENHQGDQDQQ